MEAEALDRARRRAAGAGEHPDAATLVAVLERARIALEEFADQAAKLEAGVPERLSAALEDALRGEVAPVARQLAEIRGLSGQTIRRLERLQGDVQAERTARVEDLALLVDLIASGWHGVERRLDRLEHSLDRLERSLAERPVASVYRIEDAQRRTGTDPSPG